MRVDELDSETVLGGVGGFRFGFFLNGSRWVRGRMRGARNLLRTHGRKKTLETRLALTLTHSHTNSNTQTQLHTRTKQTSSVLIGEDRRADGGGVVWS